jgi:anti-sigma factor RsiW
MSSRDAGAGCVRVRARLVELADGGLDPLAEARDRGHLEACGPCAHALAEHARGLAALRAALRSDFAHDVAHDIDRVAAAVRARIAAPQPAQFRMRPWQLVASAAAVLALLGALALGDARTARGPRIAELARLEPLVAPLHSMVAPLPGWSDVLDGLARLARVTRGSA